MQKYVFIFAAALLSMPLTQAAARFHNSISTKRVVLRSPCRATTIRRMRALAAMPTRRAFINRACRARRLLSKAAEELWSEFDGTDLKNCTGPSRMVYPSYVELLSCLQIYEWTATGVTSADQNVPQAR